MKAGPALPWDCWPCNRGGRWPELWNNVTEMTRITDGLCWFHAERIPEIPMLPPKEPGLPQPLRHFKSVQNCSRKRAFVKEAGAEAFAKTMSERYTLNFTHYLCPVCGAYHITKVKP